VSGFWLSILVSRNWLSEHAIVSSYLWNPVIHFTASRRADFSSSKEQVYLLPFFLMVYSTIVLVAVPVVITAVAPPSSDPSWQDLSV
jgi:putative flippase GtrA